MTFRKTISAALAATTLAGSLVATAAPAEARGGAFAAGLIGGVALGAIAADAYRYCAAPRATRRNGEPLMRRFAVAALTTLGLASAARTPGTRPKQR